MNGLQASHQGDTPVLKAQPLVSVVMPAHNAVRFIGEAIDSVLTQSLSDLELIVVNDGSTDDTCSAIPKSDPRVRVISRPNGGPSGARNLGLRHAAGTYIWHLDADDVLMPDALIEAVRELEACPSLSGVVGKWSVINQGGQETARPAHLWASINIPRKELFRQMLLRTLFPPSAALIRRIAIEHAGAWDEELWCAEDRDLWLRILQTGGTFRFSNHHWTKYRVHSTNATLNVQRLRSHTEQFLQKWFGPSAFAGPDHLNLRSTVACLGLIYVSRQARAAGRHTDAADVVDEAINHLRQADIDSESVCDILWEVARSEDEYKFLRALWPLAKPTVAEFCWKRLSGLVRTREYSQATRYLWEIGKHRPSFAIAKTARWLLRHKNL